MIIIMDIFDKIFNLPVIRIIYPFYKKHKGIFLYLFFGALTTLVSIFSFVFCEKVIGLDIMTTNVISWVLAVSFAYFTNKKWVFNASGTGASETARELGTFALGRVGTLGLDTVLTFGTVWALDALGYVPFKFIIVFTADLWSKIVASVVVIISNYVISKFLVFKKK